MPVTFVPGQMQEFISNIDFSLNFEDIKSSVKVRVGEIVLFDGTFAKYVKPDGKEFYGKSKPLVSAINNDWLTLNLTGVKPKAPTNLRVDNVRKFDDIPYKQGEYNDLQGGDFDAFLKKEAAAGPAYKVIQEEDHIVKRTGNQAPKEIKETKGELKVFGDQVAVRETKSTTVSSTTATTGATKTASRKIIKSDSYNADSSTPINMKKADIGAPKQKTFTVDEKTPRVRDDATLAEIKRATVINADESQDAKVVKKNIKFDTTITESEGITLKTSTGTPAQDGEEIEGINFRKTVKSADKDIDASVKVTKTSEPIADLSGVNTQEEVNAIEKKFSGKNFMELLPEDWSTMHWVKKEKFIMQQTDKEFVKFILTVEPIKAVQTACRKRLLELEK